VVARSIRIFLIDGTASGMRTAELGLSTIKALVVPRASLSIAAARSEPQRTGVYVLVGQDAEVANQKRIYVGEGDTIFDRITKHDKDPDKDFWDEAVLLVSKDDNLTKAHVRFIEARLIALAKQAKRSVVANGTAPSEQGKLPEADAVEMGEFIEQARLLLGALGYDIFEQQLSATPSAAAPPTTELVATQTVPPTFKMSGAHFDASMVVDSAAGQFIVRSGSTAKKVEVASLPPTYKNLRAQLVHSGVLETADENSFRFTQDYAFSAPTPAAQVVSGNTANGRTAWKSSIDGKTFADWQDAQLPVTISANTSS
jgi:Domain of unknown function (DUF4357)